MDVLRKVTMADVAESAGVSPSAVSAAFSARPNTSVIREETRQRILQAADALGYRPNILSRSFIKQQSFLISLLGREVFFVFALETIKGIEDILEKTDYSLLTFYHGNWSQDQAKHLEKSIARRVDGLIIAGAPEAPDGPNHETVRKLQKSGTPVVQLYRRIFPDVPVVMVDDDQIGYLATRHLMSLGHRKIAHVTHADYEDADLPGTHGDAKRRYEGYRKAMLEAGLEPKVITFDPAGFGLASKNYTAVCRGPARVLAESGCTAATTFNDYVTIGLIHALRAMHIRVPDDISLVGYDDVEAGELVDPPLTTLKPAMREIGTAAADMLLSMMKGQAVDDVVLAPRMIVRESTGPVNLKRKQ